MDIVARFFAKMMLVLLPVFSAPALADDAAGIGAAMNAAEAAEDAGTTSIIPAGMSGDPVIADPANTDRVMRALALIGASYQLGGASPETGFDCSGLVAYVFRDTVGYQLPRSADGLFRMSGADRVQPVAREELTTGDLVFFSIGRLGSRIDHVGIALGDGRFLHAPSRGGMVRLDGLDLPYWEKHYVGARRLPHALSVMAAPVKDREQAETNETLRVGGEDKPGS